MTDQLDDIPLFPIAGWNTEALPEHGVILLAPYFVSSPMQRADEAQVDRWYVITPKQAEQLVSEINRQLRRLETAVSPDPEEPTH